MKKLPLFILTSIITAFLMIPLFAYAQEAVAPAVAAVATTADPNVQFLQMLLASLGGLKGASTLAIVGAVIQMLLQFIDLPWATGVFGKMFSDWQGHKKLLTVSFLTLVGGVVSLVSLNHLSWGAALVHSTTLTAFMVFANQIYQQVTKKV